MTNENAIEILERIRRDDSPIYKVNEAAFILAIAALREVERLKAEAVERDKKVHLLYETTKREVEQARAAVEAWNKLDSILHGKDNLDVEFCYCKEIDGDGNITEDGISCRIRDYDRTKSNYESWRETEPFTTAQAAILAAKGE